MHNSLAALGYYTNQWIVILIPLTKTWKEACGLDIDLLRLRLMVRKEKQVTWYCFIEKTITEKHINNHCGERRHSFKIGVTQGAQNLEVEDKNSASHNVKGGPISMPLVPAIQAYDSSK